MLAFFWSESWENVTKTRWSNRILPDQSAKQTPEPEVTSLLDISSSAAADWPDIDLLSDSAAKTDIVASALAASDVVLNEEDVMDAEPGGKSVSG